MATAVVKLSLLAVVGNEDTELRSDLETFCDAFILPDTGLALDVLAYSKTRKPTRCTTFNVDAALIEFNKAKHSDFLNICNTNRLPVILLYDPKNISEADKDTVKDQVFGFLTIPLCKDKVNLMIRQLEQLVSSYDHNWREDEHEKFIDFMIRIAVTNFLPDDLNLLVNVTGFTAQQVLAALEEFRSRVKRQQERELADLSSCFWLSKNRFWILQSESAAETNDCHPLLWKLREHAYALSYDSAPKQTAGVEGNVIIPWTEELHVLFLRTLVRLGSEKASAKLVKENDPKHIVNLMEFVGFTLEVECEEQIGNEMQAASASADNDAGD